MKYAGIDPSTKTGLVVLSGDGEVRMKKEMHLTNGIYSSDRELLVYGREIVASLPADATAAIEGFSYGSKGKGVSTQYAVGYSIRFALLDACIPFIEVTPSQVKKFSTGKGNTTKDNMTIPIYKHWGFEHKSDNVRDAFVLAQIVKALQVEEFAPLIEGFYNYQLEVLQAIKNPVSKKKAK